MKNFFGNLKSRLDISGVSSSVTGFITSTFTELKKVEWLSRSKTYRYSIYVLIFIIGGASLIALLDVGFYEVLKLITN